MFGHEKFGEYRYATRFAAFMSETIERLPEGHAKLLEELWRATTSIALNIAEGSGKHNCCNPLSQNGNFSQSQLAQTLLPGQDLDVVHLLCILSKVPDESCG